MRPFVRAAVLAIGVLVSNVAVAAAQSSSVLSPPENDGWRNVIYPLHAWMPLFGAEVNLPAPPDGGVSPPSVETSKSLNYAALAGFRLERRRLAVDGEFLWAGLSGSAEVPIFHVNVDTIEFKLIGGVEIAPAFYVNAGVRRVALDIRANLVDFPELDWKPGLWEPLVGFTLRPQLSRNVRLFSVADFGWTSDDSHRTASISGAIEWKPWAHFALGGGYGFSYLRVNRTILNSPVHLAQTLHGPLFTLGIPF